MRSLHNARGLWRVDWPLVKRFSRSTPLAIALLAIAFASPLASAQNRFQPQDTTVLLKTESNPKDAALLRGALERWRSNPKDLNLATETARTAILGALSQGDLRWLGNAKAMLDPWWTNPALPADTLFVRALIRQGVHDFEGALTDLDAAIAKDPSSPETWAWRFAIYMVKADIPKARAECAAIGARFGQTEQSSCNAVLLYRTGSPQQAIPELERLARHPDYQGQNAQEWLAFHRGEARRVAGDRAGARKIWEAYLKTGATAHGIRVALIELLNRDQDYIAAWKHNERSPRSDALLVAAVETALALKNGQAPALIAEFQQRVTQQTARGDKTHERPHIKFAVAIQKDARKALEMAKLSWKNEREPTDALLYARAAIESNAADQASELLQWQSSTGYREPELDQHLAQIRQTSQKGKR